MISSMCSVDMFSKTNHEIYSLFEKYNSLESKIDNSETMGIIFDIGKYFLKHEKFLIAKIYLKTLTQINNSKTMMKLYNKIS